MKKLRVPKVRLRAVGRLDRYIATLFVASYSVAFFLVVGLFLIINLAGNLEDYFEPSEDGYVPPTGLVVRFYVYSVPFIYLQVAPFVTLVAGLFTASKLVRNNEIVAALNAGVSAQRLVAPVVVGGLVLAGGMFGLREWATESLGYRRDLILDHLTERRETPIYKEVWLKEPHPFGTNIVRIDEFLAPAGDATAEIRGLAAFVKGKETLVTIVADGARWDESSGRWKLRGGWRRQIEPRGEAARVEHLKDVHFTPRDVHTMWKGQERPLDLSFAETTELWRRDPDNDALQTLIEYQKTFPMANVVLLLVGLPFLVRFERGRQTDRLVAGFLLCVFYFAADFVTRSLGMQGMLTPLMASWLPVLFFGSLGVVFYSSMKT